MSRHVYILYMVCLLLIVGCSASVTHEEEIIEPVEERVPVSFGYYTGSAVATRADSVYFIDGQTVKTIPVDKRVGVFGYYQGQTKWADGTAWTADFMYNQPMTASAATTSGNVTTAKLTYRPVAYWPNTPGDMLTFMAYYPYASGSTDDTGITPQITKGNGTGSFFFRVNTKPEEQVDFLVSDIAADHKKQGVNEHVTLKFHHVLAQVSARVSVTQDMSDNGATAKVNSIELEGIRNQGICTPTYGSDGTTSFVWSSQSFSSDNSTGIFDTSALTSTDAVLLMVPQPLSETIYLTVNYDIEFYEGDELAYKYTGNKARVTLGPTESGGTSGNVTRWEGGKRYVYNVMVDLRGISVLPTVTPWIVAGEDINLKEQE